LMPLAWASSNMLVWFSWLGLVMLILGGGGPHTARAARRGIKDKASICGPSAEPGMVGAFSSNKERTRMCPCPSLAAYLIIWLAPLIV